MRVPVRNSSVVFAGVQHSTYLQEISTSTANDEPNTDEKGGYTDKHGLKVDTDDNEADSTKGEVMDSIHDRFICGRLEYQYGALRTRPLKSTRSKLEMGNPRETAYNSFQSARNFQ
jgi:hypothetical protein